MLPRPNSVLGIRADQYRMPIIAIVPLFILMTSVGWVSPADAIEPGEQAPIFNAPQLEGKGNISLGNYRGKVVYLDFWASWCPPCLNSLPDLEKLRGEFPEQRFQILAVNLDKHAKKALKFLSEHPVGFPSVSNPAGDIPDKYGLETMPTSYLIDGKGFVRYVHRGYRSGDLDMIRDEVRKIIR
jgi:peroxiredoxin